MNSLVDLTNIEINTLLYILYSFALPHHLKTFFSPFKRMTYRDEEPGISFQRIGEALSFNLVSIGVGLVVRSILIISCLLFCTIAVFLMLIIFTLAVVTYPVLEPIRWYFQKSTSETLKKWLTKAGANPGKTLINLLNTTPEGKFLSQQLVLSPQEIKAFENQEDFDPGAEIKNLSELFIAYARNYPPFKKVLEADLMDEKDIARICAWYNSLNTTKTNTWKDRDTIRKTPGFGADWSYGYTNELNKYLLKQNFTQFPKVVGHENELERLENQLSRSVQNSCLIYGEAGVGRHPIVDEFARRLYEGKVVSSLAGCKTLYLDLKSAISGQTDITNIRKKVLDLFEEGRQAGNVILVVDDIEKFFESSNEKIDLTDIFTQILTDGKLRIIGITTSQFYNKLFATNESLLKLFSPLKVEAPDLETVYEEMELSIVPVLEKVHKIKISYGSIKEAIDNSDRFVSNVPFPEKAINLLDETVTAVKTRHPHMQQLWKEDVSAYLSEKTKIPLGSLTKENKEKLANLEVSIHRRIVGQNEAVSSLAKALRRSLLSVSSWSKPIGSFLFLGPTGVGKTETAKALAESYFGSEDRILRFDMSEFQGGEGIERLIGSAKSSQPGQLTAAISENPFAILLLDEIEKSPPIILNLFLSLLDEGYITDTQNRKISATQNIIIATSNAGALFIRDQVEKGVKGDDLKKSLMDHVLQQKIFLPEFLNRFDGVIVFEPLTKEEIKIVAKNMLLALAKRLEGKKITLKISDSLVEKISSYGFDPVFGARTMRRYIQDQVEDDIAKKILAGEGAPGSTIEL